MLVGWDKIVCLEMQELVVAASDQSRIISLALILRGTPRPPRTTPRQTQERAFNKG